MTENKKRYTIFLSAAEPSADSHCANLINALKSTGYDFNFVGVGGPKMEEAGCEMLAKPADKAAMIHNAFKEVGRFIKLIYRIKRYIKRTYIDIAVVCDSPAFNFHVAKAARENGIKTMFYVAPQLWAWAPWRIRKLRRNCDKLCCILPFEEKWFGEKGLDVTFVGNPLMDGINIDFDSNIRDYGSYSPQTANIALMPGSRKAEIDTLWVPMQQIAVKIKEKYQDINITGVAVDEKNMKKLKSMHLKDLECDYSIHSVFETARKSDLSLVASGSATLQVAAAGCPMVVMYQSNKIFWHLIGRWIINLKQLSLVNILAGHELVPEYMPYFNSTEPVTQKSIDLLNDKNLLSRTNKKLIEITSPLSKNASKNTAEEILKMIQ